MLEVPLYVVGWQVYLETLDTVFLEVAVLVEPDDGRVSQIQTE